LPSILHALSDPARLEIVRRLAAGSEWSCGRFELGLSKATLSHHFRVLREAGVLRTRPDGRKRLLSLRDSDLNARFPGLLQAVLTDTRSAMSPVLSAGASGVQASATAAAAAGASLAATQAQRLRPAP
jgi:DNA-binding transcriptional ArsR family regulator